MSMRANLPKIYRTAQMVIDLDVAAEPGEIDPAEISDQMILESMTWALAIEEKIAGLAAGTDSEETRKENLRAQWRSQFDKGSLEGMQAIANSFRNGGIDISYEYPVITVSFVSEVGIPPDINHLKAALARIAPAHLRLNYVFIFVTHEELEPKTHAELAEYTYYAIRNGDW